tara:strand:- start:3 stop:158 length:156 start_codon:yes stop_codon:yes gene_type:complete
VVAVVVLMMEAQWAQGAMVVVAVLVLAQQTQAAVVVQLITMAMVLLVVRVL